jgi:hypothetical protein
MNEKAQELVRRCDSIHQGSGEAIHWIEDVRGSSPRLDRESASLTLKIRRTRNLVRRLGRAAARPLAVGFFGLSQAGKSYLISALAAGDNGELETSLDGERLNFIAHVNPPGHGREATGLVTRFTRQGGSAPRGFPIELSLFSEVDLVKVLGNAFFNDFDREQVEFNTAPAYVRKHLADLEARRRPAPTGGVDEDNVVELQDYFEQRFPRTMEQLQGDYWPTAIALAPFLDPQDRGALFSILWGEIPELTQTYMMLRDALASTGYAETLYCPISALVTRDDSGRWTQADSIVNVDILERLGKDRDDVLEFVPRRDEGLGEPIALPRALLAALTTELKFVLADPPKAELLEQVDLLDFPGYRGRLAVGNLEEVRKQLKDNQVDPVAQLVLRGKVAYLFERYTDDQEMNVLILCTPSHKQSDVKDLGPVLESWVHSTQGADPQSRARRRPGLIWAITMFDFRLAPVPGQTEDLMRKGWEGMMKMALLERFGSYNWLHDWAPGKPFDNLFLVRKPRMATAVIDTREDRELGLLPGQEERLALLRTTFVEDPTVRRHIQDSEAAWDAMRSLNDGGVSRLMDYLAGVARPVVKLERIREQVDDILDDLINRRLGAYYRREGAAEVENKKRIAELVVKALSERADRIGDLIRILQPSKDHLRALYLRAEEDPTELAARSSDSDSSPRAGGGLIDLQSLMGPGEGEAAGGSTGATEGAKRFARAAMRDWIGQLKGLPENPRIAAFLDLPRDILESLVDELLTAADRLGLEGKLLELLEAAEAQTTATRTRLVERQVFAAASRMDRFVDYLGMTDLPSEERPASKVGKARPLFAPPPEIEARELPRLPDTQINFSGIFIVDWFDAFRSLAVENAGHAAGRDIGPQQNARLGEIVDLIAGRQESKAIR